MGLLHDCTTSPINRFAALVLTLDGRDMEPDAHLRAQLSVHRTFDSSSHVADRLTNGY